MPVFMFEKISPPIHRVVQVAQVVAINEPRGVIVQMLDRITASRLKREARIASRAQRNEGFTEADISPSRTRS